LLLQLLLHHLAARSLALQLVLQRRDPRLVLVHLLAALLKQALLHAKQLLQRVEANGSATFNAIAATEAPSLTWLGDQAVVAVTNDSTVNHVVSCS
jgi:hypothetical protein